MCAEVGHVTQAQAHELSCLYMYIKGVASHEASVGGCGQARATTNEERCGASNARSSTHTICERYFQCIARYGLVW